MKISTAGLLVLAALALSGCSRPVNLLQAAVHLRDRVVADAATADAERELNGWREPWDYDGATTRRVAQQTPTKPTTQAVNPDGTPAAPVDPNAPPKPFQSAPASAPTVVYYYPAPAAGASPAP